MEKLTITCDSCKEEIHDVTAVMALGMEFTCNNKADVTVTFTSVLSGAYKHACGIKCAMDVVGKELLKLRGNAT